MQSVGGYPQQAEAIRGRSSPAECSVNSGQSVGDLSHSNHLCRSVQSVGGHPKQAEAIRGSLFAATVSRLVTNIACYSVRRTARGQTWNRQEADRCRGENIVRYCTENAAIGAESVTIPPPKRVKLYNIC